MRAIDRVGQSEKLDPDIKEFDSFVLYRIKLRVDSC